MVRVNRFFQFVEYIVRIFRFFVPWVWRAFVFTISLMATWVVSFWGGVPRAVGRISDDWLDRAIHAGFPTIWDRNLYQVLWVLAFATIVIGWVVLSYITVFVFQRIF